MPVAKVLEPGFLTTVQDLGRYGYRHQGVPVSGGVDPWALRTANMLVGNSPGDAALEITLQGPALLFLRDCIVAVTGADMELHLSGHKVPMWESFFCSAGDILSFGYRREGCRSYLAISGGIDVPVVLGSRSTLLTAGFGGLAGRRLKKGDLIKTVRRSLEITQVGNKLPGDQRPVYPSKISVKVIRGINSDRFSKREYAKLFESPFEVTGRFDRMGCCLEGQNTIISNSAATMESYPVVPGSIQVLPSGNLIVLLNDSQSTGGYPQIACVISGEVWKIGQAVPGNKIVFEETDINTAHEILNMKGKVFSNVRKESAVRFYKRTEKHCYEINLQNCPEKGNDI